MTRVAGLENLEVVDALKAAYAFDGGAEREHNSTKDSLGFGLLHYALTRNLQPDYALAIGSRYGFIPACIALALKANGKGRLHFVDANYDDQTDQFSKAYGGTGHWKGQPQQLFGTLQLHEWIDLFLERTDSFFPRSAVAYGYVYIDGNHSYEGVKYDFAEALRRLAPGGVIAIHDALVDGINGAAPTDPGGFGVKEYLKKHFPNALVIGQWPGLAVVQPSSPLLPGAPTPATQAHEAKADAAPGNSAQNGRQPLIQALDRELETLSAENRQLRQRLADQEARSEALALQIDLLSKRATELTSAVEESGRQLIRQDAYYELIARVRNAVQQHVPPGTIVSVVSKGDDQLISYASQTAWHFPRTDQGLYSGEHPRDSSEAIAALETQRKLGARYLLFPQTSFWWLDSYPEFRDYLATHYQRILQRDDTCAIFALQPPV